MAVGGSKFLLEKTWRTNAGTTQTFNAPGNVTLPYGKYEVVVTGRGGTGTGFAPPSLANYNPSTPGNPTYNPPTGGSYAGLNPSSGGNFAGTNPITGGGNYAGGNPGSGGNVSGFNPYTAGTPYPAFGAGFMYASATWFCSGSFQARYLSYTYGGSRTNFYPPSDTYWETSGAGCPAPQFAFVTYPPEPYVEYNSPSGGNANFNPYYPGESFYNPVIGGNANYNPIIPGNARYNPITPGTISGTNAVPGNANYNTGSVSVPGTPTNVLGVYLPGGLPGETGPVVSPTSINRYAYPDGATYPVTVPLGSYVTITVS